MEDIRQTGPVGLKGLKGLNRQQNKEQIPTGNDLLSRLKRTRLQGESPENATLDFRGSAVSDTGLQAMNLGYGNSRYDEGVTEAQMSNLSEVRGQEQPWYWQLTNALGKGAIQAVTTFVDGTAGLLLGTGEAIGYGLSGYNASSSLSRIFHNEISDSINEFNKYMEEVLPNYRTDEEKNNEWYQNLGTMNFWADSILKNIGFTVGSIYSGNAWNMALKGMGLLKNASTFGAKITGSLLSSINEGRQEANQNSTDMLELDKQKIYDARNRNYQEIDNLYKQRYNEIMSSEMSNSQKQANLALLNQDIQKRRTEINNTTNALLKDATDRANQAGLLDLALNVPLLTYTDYRTYGKIFASSFKGARQKAKKEGVGLFSQFRKNANKAILDEEDEVTNRIIKKDGKYLWNKITSKDNLLNAGKITLREGNEEMSQQMAANLSGEYFQPDDTDAYYKAMRNHKSNVDTKDLMTAIVNGFNSSYGDKAQWEQFVAGAINGLIGIPTFGKRANSTTNTYLGRGKMVGISGGFFGERAMGNEYNRQGSDIVDRMNKLVTDIQDKKKLMAQSKSFIDAMNGYQEADDKFEYENANDNDTFNLYTSFLQAGKEDDLKELLSQQFENFTDEQLNEIKDFVGFSKDEWLDKDGNLTDNGKEEMRKKLIERRDNLLSQFEDYKEALSIIKNTSDIPEEHQNEMAWLLWKGNRFRKRIDEILSEFENKECLQEVIDAIEIYANDLRNEQAGLKGDETRKEQYEEEDENGNKTTKEKEINILEENKKLTEQADNLYKLLNALKKGSDSAIALLADKKNKDLLDYLSSEEFYRSIKDYNRMNYIVYNDTINNLVDTYKLTSAIKSFNEKLEEYTKNPQNIDKTHKRIDDEEEEKEDLENKTLNKDKIENNSVSDLVNDDSFDIDNALSQLDEDENIDDETEEKLNEAKQITDFYKKALDKLNKQLTNGEITQQQYDIQKAALDKSKQLSENYKEFIDLDTESFNDTESINPNDIQNFINEKNQEKQAKENKDLTDDEIQSLAEEYKQQQIDKAKANLKYIQEELAGENLTEIPTIDPNAEPILSIRNSNDTDSSTTQSVQDQRRENEKRKNRKKLLNSKDKQELINQLVDNIIDTYKLQDAPKIIKTQLKSVLNSLYNYANKQAKNEVKQQNTQSYLGIALNAIKKTISYNELKNTISDIDDLVTKVYPILHSFAQDNLQANTNNKWLAWEFDHITLEDKKKDKKNYEEWKKWYENNKSISKVNDNGVTIIDSKTEAKEETTNDENTGIQTETEDNEPITPDITEKDVEITSNSIETSLGTVQSNTFNFMYPTTTEYSRFGDRTKPYHENVKDNELKKRYKTLHDFMEQHDVFKNANELSVGSVIHFGFSKSLNQSLENEMVVLMLDENGKIVGDLPTMKDKNFGKIKGLAEIYKKAFDTLNKSKDNIEDIVMIDGLESHVNNMMIGRPNYNNERLNLNTIFDNNFYLDIYVSTTKIKTNQKLKVLKPLKVKKGQPFVLIKTVGNQYYPVPFIMRKFDIVHDKTILNTTLGLAVMDVLNTIVDVKNNKECLNLKNKLLRYLAIPSLHINIIDGKLNIKIQRTTDKHPYIMLNMDLNELTEDKRKQIALKVAQNLSGQGGINFQIKLKDGINVGEIQLSNGKKISYNQAIGEIAEVNLPKGTNHTINDWFTINPIENEKKVKDTTLNITKQNPNEHKIKQEADKSTESNDIFTYKNDDIIYEFNIKTNNVVVYDKNGKVINQQVSNIRKMDLYAKAHKLNGVIKTPFGYYDTDSHKVVDKLDYLTYVLFDDLIKPYYMLFNNENEVLETINNVTEKLRKYDSDKEYKIISEKIEISNNSYQIFKVVLANYSRLSYIFDNYFDEEKNINDLLKIDNRLDKYKNDIINLGINGLITDKTEKEINDILNEAGYKPYLSITKNDKWNVNNTEQNVENKQNKEEENKEITVEDVIVILNKRSCKFNTKQKKILSRIEDKELLRKLYELENTSKLKQLLTLFNTLKINSKTDEIEKTFNKLFDDSLNRDESRVKQEDKVLWNKEKEINKVTKMLPQLEKDDAIRLVDSIENMNGNATIYGQFKNGVIYLRKDTIRGTLYHEAFHFVSQSLLTEKELSDLYSLARERYGNVSNLELEENLAEDFRQYMQKEEGFKGFFVKYWRKLKNFINTIIGNTHTIDKMFFDISRGSYANRIQHESNRTLNRIDRITNEIIQYYRDKNIILNDEQIQYLNDRKISIDDYSKMSDEEKETLWKCM